jgi:hypothetical protein
MALNADPRLLRIGYGSGVKYRVLVLGAVLIAATAVVLGVATVTARPTAAPGDRAHPEAGEPA